MPLPAHALSSNRGGLGRLFYDGPGGAGRTAPRRRNLGFDRPVREGGRMCREILVIEDEPQLARLVEMHLKDAGHRVTLAHRGDDGLAAAVSQRDPVALHTFRLARRRINFVFPIMIRSVHPA